MKDVVDVVDRQRAEDATVGAEDGVLGVLGRGGGFWGRAETREEVRAVEEEEETCGRADEEDVDGLEEEAVVGGEWIGG